MFQLIVRIELAINVLKAFLLAKQCFIFLNVRENFEAFFT